MKLLNVTSTAFAALMTAHSLVPGVTYFIPASGAMYYADSTSTAKQMIAGLSILDFPGITADGVTDDTAGVTALLAAYKKPSPTTTSQALNASAPAVFDLCGRTLTLNASASFADTYRLCFRNGRIRASNTFPVGSPFLDMTQSSGVTDPPSTPYRSQRIRSIYFEDIVFDGNYRASIALLQNTYDVRFTRCTGVHWNTGGYGIKSLPNPDGSGNTVKNTQLTIDGCNMSFAELSEMIPSEVNTSSGTGFDLHSADFVMTKCVSFACEVGINLDNVTNCQISDTHVFTGGSNYILKVGPNAQHLLLNNFYGDTGIAEFRSFSHVVSGGGFISNSQVQFVATLANETAAGLRFDTMLAVQPQWLTEGAGSWSAAPKAHFTARKADGSYVYGIHSQTFHRGTAAAPSWRFNDLVNQDTTSGFYSPGADILAVSILTRQTLRIETQLVTVGDGSGNQTLVVDGGAGTSRRLRFSSGGLKRWEMGAGGAAEAGSNAGSDLVMYRYDDSGTLIDTPVVVDRATGRVDVAKLRFTKPGSDLDYEAVTLSGLTAKVTIAQYQPVGLSSDSHLVLANANGVQCIGLSSAAYVNGDTPIVIVLGIARNDAWTWTPAQPVYLAGSAGDLTQTKPTTSGYLQQPIGFALSPTLLQVNIGPYCPTAP